MRHGEERHPASKRYRQFTRKDNHHGHSTCSVCFVPTRSDLSVSEQSPQPKGKNRKRQSDSEATCGHPQRLHRRYRYRVLGHYDGDRVGEGYQPDGEPSPSRVPRQGAYRLLPVFTYPFI